MTEDRNGKTYSFDVCSQCKFICCQDANPPLTSRRMQILRDYVTAHNLGVSELFVQGQYAHPAADANGVCNFFNKQTRLCSVHSVKPETCRAGPITFDINLQTRKVEFYLKKNEICPFAGVLYQDKAAFNQHLAAAKVEIMRLIAELDVGALKAILLIPEPETFKVDENDLPKEVAEKLGIV
jgi:Fe-S-cluster containining protein